MNQDTHTAARADKQCMTLQV